MKAITYNPNSDKFSLSELPMVEPNANEVLVKVLACALNPVDTKIVNWHASVPIMDANFVVGLDVVGEIVELSTNNAEWRVGERVLFHGDMLHKNGGLAEYTVQRADAITRMPNNVPIDVAASTPCAGWTAWRALVDRLAIHTQQSIFIAGGSGGVGSFAIQIAKHFDVKQIIVSCSARNTEYVKSLGATHVVDYAESDIKQEVMAITNGCGVDVALDCVGNTSEQVCANVLKYEGQMVELVETANLTSYYQAKLRGITVHQLSLGAGYRNGSEGIKAIVRAGRAFNELLSIDRIHPPKLTHIALEDAGKALMQIREQRTVGKIIVMLDKHA
ncbi:MAG: zinc-binding dehydrogenase [Photobacterium frigidiphilum]|uniref:zinc-binding dehydrogenase n=1 Tax=Photobacterium frigidiphilum TaxID=264736 RepID=UPI0030029D17